MRADLLKRLFESHQRRDDRGFYAAAEEIIREERKKQHPVLASELEQLISDDHAPLSARGAMVPYEPPPEDSERRTSLLAIKRPLRFLDDVVLNAQQRRSVDRLLLEFREWEVLEANGLPPVRRVLFCGPSGCGKTAAAEAVATEMSLPLLYVRFDAVISSLLGETASNLRKVFDYARRGQWVILFDEFDAIGRSRDDPTEHGEIKRVVNSFLQIMDNFDGRSLIIAATNFEQALDPAIWRRFDDVLRFDLPIPEQRRFFVCKQLATIDAPEEVVDRLVDETESASYADVERICLDLRRGCALRHERRVRTVDVDVALGRHAMRRVVQARVTGSAVPMVDQG